jgi:hypothetical protein
MVSVSMHRTAQGLLAALLLLVAAPGIPAGERDIDRRPGYQGRGVSLLPNGWRLAPAGRHIPLDDLPMDMAESPDGRFLVVTNDGYSKPVLSVVDLERLVVMQRLEVDHAWLGLVWHPDGRRLFSSAGGTGAVQELDFGPDGLKRARVLQLPHPVVDAFTAGIALGPEGSGLYAVQVFGDSLTRVDLGTGEVMKSVGLEAEPYTVLATPDGRSLYVSLWGGSKVLEVEPETLAVRRSFATGEHPSALALSPDGRRLFVACAHTNAVWVIDTASGVAQEQIHVALYPGAPPGSTPNGLGLSPDGRRLLVANADNNNVALVDVSRPGRSQVEGFVPTGWYPTAARFSRDGRTIFILSGKGLGSAANPRGPDSPNYVAEMLLGTLSVLPVPDAETLAGMTRTVYAVTPYDDAHRLMPSAAPADSPIPRRVGEESPIKHVFYVIRENRTYDQVLGDLPRGNGDPNLCLFGEEVTPNAHALAREFVQLDNFYVDAEVSADGHAFSTGAYASDFVEKTWPMNYAARGGRYVSEGGGPNRNAYGNVAAPANGYLWDAARRVGVSVRSYGEFALREGGSQDEPGTGPAQARVPGLEGLVSPDYSPWDLDYPDNKRVDAWLREFQRFEREGGLPQLSILHLPNDHTSGTRGGAPTPRAMVAENDLALGRLVEAVSKSRFWRESAIFVLEDDAQDGPDHVDAHRSVALVISPWVARGTLDSTLYTTSGILRSIELILGIEPMSQFDASATPLYGAFRSAPDAAPYALRPARISTTEPNLPEAWGAAASQAMDLSVPDRAPMRELNEILWRSVRGARSFAPPPVRAAFVRPAGEPQDEEDEVE